jgi:two-component system, NarL family, sensor histidine kinase DegS
MALETLSRELDAQFLISGSPVPLKADKELALYRVAQEALNNAQHHAQAKHIRLEFVFDANHVSLQVKDDGIGFEPPPQLNDLTRTGHFGLIGMRERAQLVDGQLNVISSISSGTTVVFKVPIQD